MKTLGFKTIMKVMLAVMAGILVTACTEEDQNGLSILPEQDLVNAKFNDTSSIIAYTITEDSVRSDKKPYSLLGSYTDPVFGNTTASFASEVHLIGTDVKFGADENPKCDSLIVSLGYYFVYGDTNVIQNVKVYQLNEQLSNDSAYYSNRPVDKGTLLGQINFQPRPNDSVQVYTKKQGPQLRIPLSTSLGDDIISWEGTSKLSSNSAFVEAFKGLYFEAQVVNGDGSISMFELSKTESQLTLYYTHDTSNVFPRSQSFSLNINCARYNVYEHDYSVAETDLSQQINGDTSIGEQQVYIQGLSGVRTKVFFPHIRNWFKDKAIAIHKAELVIPLDDTDMGLEPYENPSRLGIVYLNEEENKLYLLPDYLIGTTYHGGTYDSNKKEYVFRIGKYVQDLMMGKHSHYTLYVIADDRTTNPRRVRINGPENMASKMKLRLTYTELN